MENAKYKIQNTKLRGAQGAQGAQGCVKLRSLFFGSAAAVHGPSPSVRFADISPAPRGSLPLPLREEIP